MCDLLHMVLDPLHPRGGYVEVAGIRPRSVTLSRTAGHLLIKPRIRARPPGAGTKSHGKEKESNCCRPRWELLGPLAKAVLLTDEYCRS